MSSASIIPVWRTTPLPSILTPLLGRDREAGRITELLRDDAHRLVTLTGPGGVGKTRLALHIATLFQEIDDLSVGFVPLSSIRDPDLVLAAICQAFGYSCDATDHCEDRLLDLIGNQQILVVLDNVEQVLDAAPNIASILARCPGLTVLATGQAPLNIPGEQIFPILPLATPTPQDSTLEAILQFDAVNLFLARARSVHPDLMVNDRLAQTVAEICRRLDGLPLAIELAAARVNILSVDALLARLNNRLQVLGGDRRDVPNRLRTMRDAVSWSYGLLLPHEQRLFRRISVFEGGISLDAVESIFLPMNDNRDALGVLGGLVDHSLLQPQHLPSGEPRYLMLETLRDFGLEQLAINEEADEARSSHLRWVLELTESAAPALTGSEQDVWLLRLDQEWQNIRAAMEWSLTTGQETIGLRIGSAIWRYCATRGQVAIGRSWLEQSLEATNGIESLHRVSALNGVGYLAEDQRDFAAAEAYFQQAHTLAEHLNAALQDSQACIGLGTVAHDQGHYDDALRWHAQAAVLARTSGDQRAIAIALGNQAAVSYFQGHLEMAEQCWEETRGIVSAIGDVQSEAIIDSNLAALALDRGDYERSQALLERALKLQQQQNDIRNIPFTQINLAETWIQLGDFAYAEMLLSQAIDSLRKSGDLVAIAIALGTWAELALAQHDPVRAATFLLESLPLLADAGDQLNLAGNAEVLARCCAISGIDRGAAELLAAATAIRSSLAAPPSPVNATVLGDLKVHLRQSLGDENFDTASLRGAELEPTTLPRRMSIIAHELISMPPRALPVTPSLAVPTDLSKRELDVLRLLAEGQSTQQISESLSISPRTTTTHIANMLGKLGVSTRTAAVAHALRTGLV